MAHAHKKAEEATFTERGINLDVPGTELIAQADERIKWHKRMVTTMGVELEAIKRDEGGDGSQVFERRSRRTDLQQKIDAHLEYARFLTFVRKSLVRTRRYRLSFADLDSLELMPKASYR